MLSYKIPLLVLFSALCTILFPFYTTRIAYLFSINPLGEAVFAGIVEFILALITLTLSSYYLDALRRHRWPQGIRYHFSYAALTTGLLGLAYAVAVVVYIFTNKPYALFPTV